MKKVVIKIGGMGCDHCKKTIEECLNSKDGINVKVSLENENAKVEYDSSKDTLDDIKKYIEDIGYEYLGVE